jgi:hypothetical protein
MNLFSLSEPLPNRSLVTFRVLMALVFAHMYFATFPVPLKKTTKTKSKVRDLTNGFEHCSRKNKKLHKIRKFILVFTVFQPPIVTIFREVFFEGYII